MQSKLDSTCAKNGNRSFRPVSVSLTRDQKTMGFCLMLFLMFNMSSLYARLNNSTSKPSYTSRSMDVDKTLAEQQKSHPRNKSLMKRRWGVEVVFVRQNAAGYMLEFRYRVLDAEKAKSLFKRQTKPVLIHARTGAELVVPTPAKTGALRNSNAPLVNHTYWMFFANPGKLVKVGDKVSIKIGDFIAKDLVVK